MKKGTLAGITLLAGVVGGVTATGMVMKKLVGFNNKEVDLYQGCYNIVSQWLCHKQSGVSLEKYFVPKGYHSIAIYGMGRLGSLLYEDLRDTDIEVKYAIDQDPYCTYPGLNVIKPEDELKKVDAIIVTPVLIFDEIENMLLKKTTIPVISIEEVVYEV